MKKHVVNFLKIAIPIAIIAWLLSNVPPDQIEQLRSRPKDWGRLGAAFAIAFTAVCITFVRWFLLVRTIDMPFRLRDAFRLGFL